MLVGCRCFMEVLDFHILGVAFKNMKIFVYDDYWLPLLLESVGFSYFCVAFKNMKKYLFVMLVGCRCFLKVLDVHIFLRGLQKYDNLCC